MGEEKSSNWLSHSTPAPLLQTAAGSLRSLPQAEIKLFPQSPQHDRILTLGVRGMLD
jgi:hypothetical protein